LKKIIAAITNKIGAIIEQDGVPRYVNVNMTIRKNRSQPRTINGSIGKAVRVLFK